MSDTSSTLGKLGSAAMRILFNLKTVQPPLKRKTHLAPHLVACRHLKNDSADRYDFFTLLIFA
jgi:hypothetical protein